MEGFHQQKPKPQTLVKHYIFSDKGLLLSKHADGTYSVPDGDIDDISSDNFEFVPLRQSWNYIPQKDYDAAAKYAELDYWDKTNHFCSICGGEMKKNTEISKVCTKCGREIWPQLAIAVIVRITRPCPDNPQKEEILLIRARNFRHDFYGLVAGFVETGESLEQTITREVSEEVGLEITDIRYFASQPWPYPCNLMVGFTAKYLSGEIKVQQDELITAGWFTKDNLPKIPEKLSIARKLIDDWTETHY